MRKAYATVDDYIRSFPAPTRRLLSRLRAIIREAAPSARERISYGIPTFTGKRNLVHFAAFPTHIGLYGAVGATRPIESRLAKYRTGKGTLRFSLDKPFPKGLIQQIVRLAVRADAARPARR